MFHIFNKLKLSSTNLIMHYTSTIFSHTKAPFIHRTQHRKIPTYKNKNANSTLNQSLIKLIGSGTVTNHVVP